MSTPYLGQILMTGFGFAPKGYALCDGQLLSIQQNQALFSLLGTTYGGNGISTFGLPNLQGCAPVHMGSNIIIGESGGEANHTLTSAELPSHTHNFLASVSPAVTSNPGGSTLAEGSATVGATYASGPAGVALAPSQPGPPGGGQPHSNMQPYLVLNFVIALQGIFPSRN